MELLDRVKKLIDLYHKGALGGETMPEDSNPHFEKSSANNYLYFTLPMALNYQRNSYTLWQSALSTYNDKTCLDVFEPNKVVAMSGSELKTKLTKYKVALQPNKQPIIWRTLCETIVRDFDGDIRNLFVHHDYDIAKIKDYILSHKKDFPYLSGISAF